MGSGCHLLTGANDLTLEDGEGAASSESGPGSTASQASTQSTGSESTGSGSQLASSGSEGSTTSGPINCDYPAGPYGRQAGLVLDPDLAVEAYLEGASGPSMVTAQDLFDCQGQNGTKALLITTSSLT